MVKNPLWQTLCINRETIPNSFIRIKKKLDNALEKVGKAEVIIGLLDESSVADCTGKSRVINTKKIKTLNTYRSKRLFSYFGCLCLGGKSVVKVAEKCKKEDCLKFFKEIKQANPEKILIIILDNAKIHKAKIVQDFCQNNQIILVYLPSYSPNLNPIEFMWKDLKKRLSEYYQENVENLKRIGQLISEELLESRQLSYTAKWREKFL
ncbi:MAG: IS630 family transposase [Xenococcaceae cyanobacterium MO_207.B15]|nr:IS630 family transposase [Xenococcaceae cyanobacterium MO_207.B15]